jgi:hypothetical protein
VRPQVYRKIDVNGDGVISADELVKFRAVEVLEISGFPAEASHRDRGGMDRVRSSLKRRD